MYVCIYVCNQKLWERFGSCGWWLRARKIPVKKLRAFRISKNDYFSSYELKFMKFVQWTEPFPVINV